MEMAFVPNCTGQITRVARRFGLVAAAGELASGYGLTGQSSGTALYAVLKCYRAWLDSFGALGNREERVILSQARAFFESHGASRFDNIKMPNNERINNRAGFYTTADNGDRLYMVLSEVFKNEVCKGFDPKIVARVLVNSDWLIPSNDGRTTQKIRVRGIGIPRLYVFSNRIWDEEQLKIAGDSGYMGDSEGT